MMSKEYHIFFKNRQQFCVRDMKHQTVGISPTIDQNMIHLPQSLNTCLNLLNSVSSMFTPILPYDLSLVCSDGTKYTYEQAMMLKHDHEFFIKVDDVLHYNESEDGLWLVTDTKGKATKQDILTTYRYLQVAKKAPCLFFLKYTIVDSFGKEYPADIFAEVVQSTLAAITP